MRGDRRLARGLLWPSLAILAIDLFLARLGAFADLWRNAQDCPHRAKPQVAGEQIRGGVLPFADFQIDQQSDTGEEKSADASAKRVARASAFMTP